MAHKHEWYSVGGDNYGALYDVCIKEGCTAERHMEEKTNGSYASRTYSKGRVNGSI